EAPSWTGPTAARRPRRAVRPTWSPPPARRPRGPRSQRWPPRLGRGAIESLRARTLRSAPPQRDLRQQQRLAPRVGDQLALLGLALHPRQPSLAHGEVGRQRAALELLEEGVLGERHVAAVVVHAHAVDLALGVD